MKYTQAQLHTMFDALMKLVLEREDRRVKSYGKHVYDVMVKLDDVQMCAYLCDYYERVHYWSGAYSFTVTYFPTIRKYDYHEWKVPRVEGTTQPQLWRLA